jgi:hypothetical protein
VHEERHDCANQKYHEQYFGDARGAGSNTAETKYGSDEGNDEKDDSIVKHGDPLGCVTTQP